VSSSPSWAQSSAWATEDKSQMPKIHDFNAEFRICNTCFGTNATIFPAAAEPALYRI
jgi:hypothetical protein